VTEERKLLFDAIFQHNEVVPRKPIHITSAGVPNGRGDIYKVYRHVQTHWILRVPGRRGGGWRGWRLLSSRFLREHVNRYEWQN
jgi:hypothetical protein